MHITIITYLPLVWAMVSARGPHHPRGGKVVKRHVHYRPTKEIGEKLTEDVQLLHDREHIKEHLEEVISKPDLSKMTEEELEFYYFQIHDTDKNGKLDGLEMLQAIYHVDQNDEYREDAVETTNMQSDFEYYIELIDEALREDDIDLDGYLSYSEFVAGRRNNKAKEGRPDVKMIPLNIE